MEKKQNGFRFALVTKEILSISLADYSTRVVYTKTIIIIHLSVGEVGGYLTSHEANHA